MLHINFNARCIDDRVHHQLGVECIVELRIGFHGGFGLLNIYGIPKPAYRAFELLHRSGNEMLKVTGAHETVDTWITRDRDTITIFVTNWALPRHEIKVETISVQLNGINAVKNAYLERIDDTHANTKQAWVDLGSPASLTPDQVEHLEWKSSLIKEAVDISNADNSITIILNMLPQATACITLEINE